MKFTDINGQSVSFELYNQPYINASQAKMILKSFFIIKDDILMIVLMTVALIFSNTRQSFYVKGASGACLTFKCESGTLELLLPLIWNSFQPGTFYNDTSMIFTLYLVISTQIMMSSMAGDNSEGTPFLTNIGMMLSIKN